MSCSAASRALAIALLVSVIACSDATTSQANRPARPPISTHDAVRQLEGASLPGPHAAALQSVRTSLQELEPAILAGLEDPSCDGFLDCVKLASELRLASAVPLLLEAVNLDKAPWRGEALTAANHIKPVATETLLPLLQHVDQGLLLAALRALAGRRDAPFETLLSLLGDEDPEVATAAAAALPPLTTAEQCDALMQASLEHQAAAADVLRALGRRPLPRALLDHWLQHIDSFDAGPQLAILEVARNQPQGLTPGPLRELAATEQGALGFEALRCLVAGKLVDANWLQAHAEAASRTHRLVCALGLLQQHQPEGGRILYQLAFGDSTGEMGDSPSATGQTGDEAPAMPEGEVVASDPVCILARQLMSRMADLPLVGDPAAFAAWSEHPKVLHTEALMFTGSAAALFPAAKLDDAAAGDDSSGHE